MTLNRRTIFVTIITLTALLAGSVVAYQEYRAQQQQQLEALHCNTCDARKQKQVQAREKRMENLIVENPEKQ